MVFDKLKEFFRAYINYSQEAENATPERTSKEAIRLLLEESSLTPEEISKKFCHFSGIFIPPNLIENINLNQYRLVDLNYRCEKRNYIAI